MNKSLVMTLLGVVFSALWASAFIAGKVAMEFVDPIPLLCLRFLLAGFLMFAAVSLMPSGQPIWSLKFLKDAIVLGFLNNALYLGLTFWSMHYLSPATVVLLVSSAPFLTLLITRLQGEIVTNTQYFGTILGILGVGFVVGTPDIGDAILPLALGLLGVLAFAFGTLYFKKYGVAYNPVAINAGQNLFGGIILLPFSLSWFWDNTLPYENARFILTLSYLVLVISIIDFLIWLYLIRKIGPQKAMAFHLLNPIFGVGISYIVLGTTITTRMLLGALLIIIGLFFVLFNRTSLLRGGTKNGGKV
ncbi:DMT family transporter [Bartonella sp. LJL80]